MHRSIRLLCFAALLNVVLSNCGKGDEKDASAVKGWGTFVDPARDCQVTVHDGSVTITVPKTHHDLNPTAKFDKNTDAPRILQTVEGDFDVQVSVEPFPIPEKGTSNNRGGHSYCGAGLVVWHNDKSFIRWFRAANGERGDVFYHCEWWDDAQSGRLSYAPGLTNRERRIPNVTAHLRLKREGHRITFYRSGDGKTWEAFVVLPDCPFGDKLQVGIAANNSANKEFSPTFENFKLTD